jgi:hypothetical protein|uniref:hypothetical protein n=1 Tax=Nonlabens sp. Ci31 TaxID=2608253 RepID=UPI00147457C5|nr:hypothetical protein [Nonlabens sp. Ci31]
MNKKGSIYLIALGSIIVLVGAVMFLTEVVGAKGMILIGFFTELAGVYFYWQNKKTK